MCIRDSVIGEADAGHQQHVRLAKPAIACGQTILVSFERLRTGKAPVDHPGRLCAGNRAQRLRQREEGSIRPERLPRQHPCAKFGLDRPVKPERRGLQTLEQAAQVKGHRLLCRRERGALGKSLPRRKEALAKSRSGRRDVGKRARVGPRRPRGW